VNLYQKSIPANPPAGMLFDLKIGWREYAILFSTKGGQSVSAIVMPSKRLTGSVVGRKKR
jgi:hypothetical protein